MAHRACRFEHLPFFGAAGSALATEDNPMIAMPTTILRNIAVPPSMSANSSVQIHDGTM
jgi:hypothetical protein